MAYSLVFIFCPFIYTRLAGGIGCGLAVLILLNEVAVRKIGVAEIAQRNGIEHTHSHAQSVTVSPEPWSPTPKVS